MPRTLRQFWPFFSQSSRSHSSVCQTRANEYNETAKRFLERFHCVLVSTYHGFKYGLHAKRVNEQKHCFQRSVPTADVCLPDACRRSRPVPTGLRQRCADRLTRLPVQPSPVGNQRCRTIHRRPAALGLHHRHARQLPWLNAPDRACIVQAGDDRLFLSERHCPTWLQTCDVCPTCRRDDVCGPH